MAKEKSFDSEVEEEVAQPQVQAAPDELNVEETPEVALGLRPNGSWLNADAIQYAPQVMNALALTSSKVTAELAHNGATPQAIKLITSLRDAVEQELEVMDEGAQWKTKVTLNHTYEYREVDGGFRVRPRSFVGPAQTVKSLDALD